MNTYNNKYAEYDSGVRIELNRHVVFFINS